MTQRKSLITSRQDIDAERDLLMRDCRARKMVELFFQISGIGPTLLARNGEGIRLHRRSKSTSGFSKASWFFFSIVVERLTGASWYGRQVRRCRMMSMLVRSVIGSRETTRPHAGAGNISRVADESHVQRIARNAVGGACHHGQVGQTRLCSWCVHSAGSTT